MQFVNALYKRFFLATLIWLIAWPAVYWIKLGEITGAKAWFWIIGELNYPVAAIAYLCVDSLLKAVRLKPWMIFVGAVMIIAIAMPFYYERIGFALGVSLEARLF